MNTDPALVVLSNGDIFEGVSIGASGECVGELVFNTAMTGYQEMLTDPSYAGQIITLTTAHVGNTGCNFIDMESAKAWALGLVVRDCPEVYSNYRANHSLSYWLKQQGVVGVAGIDTRALTHRLREHGSMGVCLSVKVDDVARLQGLASAYNGLKGVDLTQMVSRLSIENWTEGQGAWGKGAKQSLYHVVVYDFGVKHSILKILYDLGCKLTLVPANTPSDTALAMKPDGIFLSNGPGDPAACVQAIKATQVFLEHNIPLFGICLGFQILGLACGAKTLKMEHGHHGANHPVQECSGRRSVLITSQNHGFAIDKTSLPEVLIPTHISLFDGSLQGIIHRDKWAFGFQGHPEASPGPHDIEFIFKQFIDFIKSSRLASSSSSETCPVGLLLDEHE